MDVYLLSLPNELIEIIVFYVIAGPWKNDVRDFLSFTSTCRRFQQLVHDERYWRIMALRRDPTCTALPNSMKWFDYCQQSKIFKNKFCVSFLIIFLCFSIN